MINDYFKETEYVVNHLAFWHDGIHYTGNGILRWNPEKSFHLSADVTGSNSPSRKEFRSISFVKPVRIRMELNRGWGKMTALTAPLRVEQMGLYMGTLSLNFSRILFSVDTNTDTFSKENWYGSSIYEIQESIMLPDSLITEVKIGDKKIREGFARAGFYFDRIDGERIVGEAKDDKYLYFDWQLPKQSWTKSQSWNYAKALQLALSIVSGEVGSLRCFEFLRNHRRLTFYDAYGKPTSLGLVYRFFDFDFLDKNLVTQLASFLSTKGKEQDIIKRMFWQASDAAGQNSQTASELILATILEAALRTLYNIPFVEGRPSREDPYRVKDVLHRFQLEYLPETNLEGWQLVVGKVINAYERLRHRNAHPDWLSTSQGMLSSAEQEQTFNDLILLSRFYGYMILAISGLKDFEPKFPAPISNWKPMITMETTK